EPTPGKGGETMPAVKPRPPVFKINDLVSLQYGPQRMIARIVEDRGPLGVNRRRLYRVRLELDATQPTFIEMPGQDLQAVPIPDKTAIVEHLQSGGLVSILQEHLIRAPESPRVWITFDYRGNLTHTLSPYGGLIGGAIIPYFALHEEKIWSAKKDTVVAFL